MRKDTRREKKCISQEVRLKKCEVETNVVLVHLFSRPIDVTIFNYEIHKHQGNLSRHQENLRVTFAISIMKSQ